MDRSRTEIEVSGERIWNSLAILIVVVCLILAYAYVFGRPTMYIWHVKQEAAHNPKSALVPIPLPDTSISTTPGRTVTLFGYQFELPWKEQVVVKNPGDDYLAVVYKGWQDKPLMFFNPAKNQGLVKTTRADLKERGIDPRNADLFLNANSDYDLVRSILYATPAQPSLVFPRKKEVSAAMFLMIKQTEILGAETGLYSFQIGQLRGFQKGDASRARSVQVEAFDRDDREYKFVFGCMPGSDLGFKQKDINRVMQTLRPAPSSQQ